MNKEGFVYLLCDSVQNLYKIGRTKTSVEKRLKQLQTGSPNPIHIVKFFKTSYPSFIETKMHKHFEDKNINNEWFELNSDDVNSFEKLCEEKLELAKLLENNYFGKNLLK